MFKWVPALLAACVLAAGCSSTDSATAVPTQPTSFADPTTVDTFTGTLTIAGTDSHPFAVPVAGVVNITLTSMDPAIDSTTPVVLAIGLPSQSVVGQCATIQSVSVIPGTTPQITGHALSGTFCVSVSDPNVVLTASEAYTVTVAHP
ncbi:MAG TPA: hypothetical protein VFA59_04170 [Vicinamibacterales bacterium]|nr:hypothetical protein [Vicinamibacterales bacterium]